ncbi:MAG: ACT domain-containing protein [Ferruginibacter sp.]
MAGEASLTTLLQQMEPVLNEGEFVFCSTGAIDDKYWQKAIGTFREKEGLTVIINKMTADEFNLSYELVFSWITLTVHSALEAVGLTAAFSTALSNEGISCNVVAAFYHDHIFVPQKDADKAMSILQNLGG